MPKIRKILQIRQIRSWLLVVSDWLLAWYKNPIVGNVVVVGGGGNRKMAAAMAATKHIEFKAKYVANAAKAADKMSKILQLL